MKVLQLGKYYYPYMGGMENHLYLLCNLLKSEVDLDVLVCNSSRRTLSERIEGVSVTRCGSLLDVASTALCPSMPLALSRRRYDILHFHFPHPMGVMAYLASRKPRAHRVVITYHSDVVRQKRLLALYAPFMHRVMRRASAVICTSPNYLDSSPTLQAYAGKCRVIPYGIDLRQFALTPEIEVSAAAIRARHDAPLLLAVGRLIYYKGFEYLIRSMARVNGGARLLLAGEGPLQPALEALALECGVRDRVVFLGNIHNRDLAPYYLASEMFVFPSIARSEAFGIVQLEAMACGRPVVNTSLDSGVPFVSRHEESGLTVPPEDPDALAGAINRLLGDSRLAAAYGAAGKLRVEREFSMGVMSERVLGLYRELAEQPSRVEAADR